MNKKYLKFILLFLIGTAKSLALSAKEIENQKKALAQLEELINKNTPELRTHEIKKKQILEDMKFQNDLLRHNPSNEKKANIIDHLKSILKRARALHTEQAGKDISSYLKVIDSALKNKGQMLESSLDRASLSKQYHNLDRFRKSANQNQISHKDLENTISQLEKQIEDLQRKAPSVSSVQAEPFAPQKEENLYENPPQINIIPPIDDLSLGNQNISKNAEQSDLPKLPLEKEFSFGDPKPPVDLRKSMIHQSQFVDKQPLNIIKPAETLLSEGSLRKNPEFRKKRKNVSKNLLIQKQNKLPAIPEANEMEEFEPTQNSIQSLVQGAVKEEIKQAIPIIEEKVLALEQGQDMQQSLNKDPLLDPFSDSSEQKPLQNFEASGLLSTREEKLQSSSPTGLYPDLNNITSTNISLNPELQKYLNKADTFKIPETLTQYNTDETPQLEETPKSSLPVSSNVVEDKLNPKNKADRALYDQYVSMGMNDIPNLKELKLLKDQQENNFMWDANDPKRFPSESADNIWKEWTKLKKWHENYERYDELKEIFEGYTSAQDWWEINGDNGNSEVKQKDIGNLWKEWEKLKNEFEGAPSADQKPWFGGKWNPLNW